MKQYLKDDIAHSDIVALRRHISALDECLVKLNRDRGHNYKELMNERKVAMEMSMIQVLIDRISDELPPAQITVLK
ncbi:hypothetical protein [Ligilactobacillus agilis]|uniref:hypothetical protein n=1 Tax=Ligilactobacillus agilis TaxID=1601 RepID=UPI001958D64C|nr:hypothetical protein [Ligilactobacillus agilis]MBM6764243.1 hypothetical protein [Ligilactobacillus agilis]